MHELNKYYDMGVAIFIDDTCISAMVAIKLNEARYTKESKQGPSEILSFIDCIPENLEHCDEESTLCGIFSAHIPTTRDIWKGRSR